MYIHAVSIPLQRCSRTGLHALKVERQHWHRHREWRVKVSFVDTSDPGNIETAFRQNTRLVFFETPANPTLKLTDIKAVSDIAHENGAIVMVDNTYIVRNHC